MVKCKMGGYVMYCFKKFFIYVLFLTSIISSHIYAADMGSSFFLKDIQLYGEFPKEKALQDITSKYKDQNITTQELQSITIEIKNYFKGIGFRFLKVSIPEQDIKLGILKIKINVAKVGNIIVDGEKYYKKEFIISGFHQQSGDFLNYTDMIRYLMFLNEYNNLQVKSFLKKSDIPNSTDIVLKVEDNRHMGVSVGLDNLGSKSTSLYRTNLNLDYGNLFLDGDIWKVNSILSIFPQNTKAIETNYTLPIISTHSKLKFGYTYTNYLAGGDFSILNAKGDTNIYNIQYIHPFTRTLDNKIDISLGYTHKDIKNFILGTTSSKEKIHIIDGSLNLQKNSILYNSFFNINTFLGKLNNDSIIGRYHEDTDFSKLTFSYLYNQFINEKANIVFSTSGQYTPDKLPAVEMFSIGGLSTVRGFDSGYKLGDSGFNVSLEPFYKVFSNFRIGVFTDYGQVSIKNPVPGENIEDYLFGTGTEGILNIDNKYTARICIGYPLSSSDKNYERKINLYATLSIKLW